MCKFTDHKNDPSSRKADPTDLTFIPSNELCRKAYDFCSSHLHPSILHHSIRVFLHAKHIITVRATIHGTPFKWSPINSQDSETLLFIAAMFHDMGTTDLLNGDERFEICGADAATTFIRTNAPEIDERDVYDVWTAIACHTSAGIAERIAPLARVLRLAVLVDFDRPGLRVELRAVELSAVLEGKYARMDIERVLGDALVAQIMSKADGEGRLKKGPKSSWPGGLLKGYLEMQAEGKEGVNKYF
jgi:hypothetical protein